MGTYNRRVKFGLKIHNRFGKKCQKKIRGIFMTQSAVVVGVILPLSPRDYGHLGVAERDDENRLSATACERCTPRMLCLRKTDRCNAAFQHISPVSVCGLVLRVAGGPLYASASSSATYCDSSPLRGDSPQRWRQSLCLSTDRPANCQAKPPPALSIELSTARRDLRFTAPGNR